MMGPSPRVPLRVMEGTPLEGPLLDRVIRVEGPPLPDTAYIRTGTLFYTVSLNGPLPVLVEGPPLLKVPTPLVRTIKEGLPSLKCTGC